MHVSDETAVLAIDALSFPTPMKESMLHYELTENRLAHYQVLTQSSGPQEAVVGFAGYWLLGDEVHVSTIAVHPAARPPTGELLLLNLLFWLTAIPPAW
ncbi:MAG: hypothetical protein M5U34_43020 [Chloroflexi bacterium]|nr:hypothetical protein [Chloroflexota bacterium]